LQPETGLDLHCVAELAVQFARFSAMAAAAAIATSPQRRPRLPQKLPSDILTLQSKGHLNLVATSALGGKVDVHRKKKTPLKGVIGWG
jgi:hypothetical protein